MYDSTCKFIAAQFPEDMAKWLLGKAITLTEIKPSELSLEPIRADSVIFLRSDQEILHIEFQTNPLEEIPFRMVDYAIRLHRKYPGLEIYQVVIYLKKSSSPLVKQTEFKLTNTTHRFNVVRLWEVPSEVFLENKGLFPFAALSKTDNREEVLRQVGEKIEEIDNRTERSNISASTAILAGLLLEKTMIQRLLRNDIMQESVIYQEIKAEGKREGKLEGKQEGKLEGKREEGLSFIFRLLNRRIGEISPDKAAKISQLPLNTLEDLGEALLDFNTPADLSNWLDKNS